mmetsp:Transcript_21454/g.66565  ORF Transcript_21454/g.66565 Transcript_21454/m.66565 type:complete len:213 (-) Transcript_21454:68-706(-)
MSLPLPDKKSGARGRCFKLPRSTSIGRACSRMCRAARWRSIGVCRGSRRTARATASARTAADRQRCRPPRSRPHCRCGETLCRSAAGSRRTRRRGDALRGSIVGLAAGWRLAATLAKAPRAAGRGRTAQRALFSSRQPAASAAAPMLPSRQRERKTRTPLNLQSTKNARESRCDRLLRRRSEWPFSHKPKAGSARTVERTSPFGKRTHSLRR